MSSEAESDFWWQAGGFLLDLLGEAQAERSSSSDPSIAPLLASLESIHQTNREILDVLRNPTRTAGDEMLERASLAYDNGWYDDAFRDADQSISIYPYRASAHLLKALASAALRRPAETASALDATVRYAVGDELPVGASAVLLMAGIADAAGSSRAAIRVLDTFRAKSGDAFPEIVLAMHIRAPEDDRYFAGAVAALQRGGLEPAKRDVPAELRGLTTRLDEYFDDEVARGLARDAAERGVATIVAHANEVIARQTVIDGWLLHYLASVDLVALGPPRASWSVRDLAGAYRLDVTGDWISAYADLAGRLHYRLDEFARMRIATAPPGTPFADLTPFAVLLDEVIALRDGWVRAAAASAAAATAAPAAPVPVLVGDAAGQPPSLRRPAFAVPLALTPSGDVRVAIVDSLASAPRRRVAGLPQLEFTHNRPVVGNIRFLIASPSQRWELMVNVWKDSVVLTGGAAPVTASVKVTHQADFVLRIDGALHLLRYIRAVDNPWHCTLWLDGEQVCSYQP